MGTPLAHLSTPSCGIPGHLPYPSDPAFDPLEHAERTTPEQLLLEESMGWGVKENRDGRVIGHTAKEGMKREWRTSKTLWVVGGCPELGAGGEVLHHSPHVEKQLAPGLDAAGNCMSNH